MQTTIEPLLGNCILCKMFIRTAGNPSCMSPGICREAALKGKRDGKLFGFPARNHHSEALWHA